TDTSAVGFRVENGTLDLAVFTASKESTDGTNFTHLSTPKKFTGFEGNLGAAQLQGVDAVKLIGTGLYLKLNRTSVAGGAVLNWTQTPLSSSNVALGPNDPTFQIGGTVALSIADLVFGRATVDVRRTQVSGVSYRTSRGTTELLEGELLGIAITQATLFIGTGASLNTANGTLTLPEPTDASAVGFSVTGGSLDLGVFTARNRSTNGGSTYNSVGLTPRKYTGLEGALGTARLQGVDAFKLTGTALYLKLNQTSVSGAAVLDWKQTGLTTNVLASAGVDLGPTDPTFQIGGTVGLSIADVVFGRATVSVSRSVLTGVDDPTIAGSAAVLKGELLSVLVTGATLFIGTGATFNVESGEVNLPASNDANAVGFSVNGGTLNLAVFTAREASSNGTTYTPLGTSAAPVRKYTGLSGSLGKAQLQGVDAVKVIGTGLVLQLNSASVGGAVLDWTQPLLSGSKVGLSPADPEFRIGGSIGLSIADVVLGNATLNLNRTTVSGVNVTDSGVVKTLKGDLLAFEITEAQLFIGSGASLNVNESSEEFGTATLPGSTDPVAVGFSVSGGSLSLGIFTAQAEFTGTSYTPLTTIRKYTGLQASLGKAQMQGVDAVKLISTDLVFQLNKTSVSQGGVLDWTQSAVASAGVVLRATDPTFRIGGSVGLSIADVVFGSANITVSLTSVSGVDDPSIAGTVARLRGSLLAVNITGATLFIGSGASLNEDSNDVDFGKVTLPASNDAKAVGFSVSGGSLNLGIFTARESAADGQTYETLGTVRKYTGLEGALGKAQLQGVDVVKLIGVDLFFRLNRVSTGTAVLDWTQSFQAVNPLVDAAVDLRATDPTFQIGGSAGFSIADVVFGNATINVSRSLVTGVDDPDVSGTVARLKGELLSIRITGADLFIGSGASLNTNSASTGFGRAILPDSNSATAVGFRVEGGTLDLGIFTAREVSSNGTTYSTLSSVRKFTGFEGSLGAARLQGVDVVKIIGTNLSLQLNRTSVTGGLVLDWKQTALTTNALAGASVDLGPTDPTFRIGGTVGLSIADVVLGNATVAVSRSVVSGVDDPDEDGTVARLQGDLLSVAITEAALFIGSGATLNEVLGSTGYGTVQLPESNDPKAVGFSVSGGSLQLGIFTARDEAITGSDHGHHVHAVDQHSQVHRRPRSPGQGAVAGSGCGQAHRYESRLADQSLVGDLGRCVGLASVVAVGGGSVAQPFGSHLPHRWSGGLEHCRSGVWQRDHQCEPLRGERRHGHGLIGHLDAPRRFVRHRDHSGQAVHRQRCQPQYGCRQRGLWFGDVAGEQRCPGGGLQCRGRHSGSRRVHSSADPRRGRFVFDPA
ncbi:MAG: hypothetical protein RIS24_2230, partial [Verrucomicrobiota bacterium]